MTLDELNYEELMNKPKLRFEAYGKTYPYKEEFKSWAWSWNPTRKYWFLDPELGTEEDDLAVVRARDMAGVEVRMIDTATGEMKILGPLKEVK